LLERLLDEAMEAGRIRRMDTKMAHHLLNSLCIEVASRRSLFGEKPFGSTAEREAYFEEAWALFVRGMR
jgi:hypothetical protein